MYISFARRVLKWRFKNCLLGLAVGDALGMPVEGLSRDQIIKIYGKIDNFLPSPNGYLSAGEWTDDTEQMLVLANSMLESGCFDPNIFAKKLKLHYVESINLNFRLGPTSKKAIERLLKGYDWTQSGVYSDTCGAAMRVAPIGLVYHFNPNLVRKYSELSARVTHKGIHAISGAISVALAISYCILDLSDSEIVQRVIKNIKGYSPLLARKIELSYKISEKPVDFAISKLGNSISSLDVVPMAFYCYFSSISYKECVLKAVNGGGDTDSIAAIAGALKGARGEKVPRKWINKINKKEIIIKASLNLFRLYKRINKK